MIKVLFLYQYCYHFIEKVENESRDQAEKDETLVTLFVRIILRILHQKDESRRIRFQMSWNWCDELRWERILPEKGRGLVAKREEPKKKKV